MEITTGPLGQGFANGVGMAMGAAHLADKFNREGFPLIDNFVYAIVSDGDLMEGVASEAASLAGHLKLGRLIYLYDDNRVTIEGFTTRLHEACPKASPRRHRTVEDGNDLEASTRHPRNRRDRPTPHLRQDRHRLRMQRPDAQGPLDAPAKSVKETKRQLGWPEDETFHVPEEARTHFNGSVERGARLEAEWNALVERYEREHEELGRSWRVTMSGELPDGWETHLPTFESAKPMATRAASGECINALAPHLPMLFGGSADSGSHNTDIKTGSFRPTLLGAHHHFGVRENARVRP